MRQQTALARARYERSRSLIHEFAKFAVIGVAGVFITNAVYDLLYIHLGLGPVTSTTIATIVATIVSYLGNRYWSFRDRQRTGVVREIVVFAVLNGIGLLIQDAAMAFNYYALGLGHDKLAGFIALNTGIVLATLFRFWSYRHFVWGARRPAMRAQAHPLAPSQPADLPASPEVSGVARSNRAAGPGSHQLTRPNRVTRAGARTPRMTVASMMMPAANPVERILTSVTGTPPKAVKARQRMRAPEVTSRPV